MVMLVAEPGIVIAGCKLIAVRRHQIALCIRLERAGTRVADLPVRQKNLKKAAALNRKIQRIAGAAQVALDLHNFGVAGPRAEADLQTGSNGGLLRGRRTRHDFILINKVGELHAPRLKSGCAGVSQVVGDVVQVELLRGHTRCRGVECMKHSGVSFSRPLASSCVAVLSISELNIESARCIISAERCAVTS